MNSKEEYLTWIDYARALCDKLEDCTNAEYLFHYIAEAQKRGLAHSMNDAEHLLIKFYTLADCQNFQNYIMNETDNTAHFSVYGSGMNEPYAVTLVLEA